MVAPALMEVAVFAPKRRGAALGTVSLEVLATGIPWPPCWENATMNAPSLPCDLLQSAGRREIFRKCWFLWKL